MITLGHPLYPWMPLLGGRRHQYAGLREPVCVQCRGDKVGFLFSSARHGLPGQSAGCIAAVSPAGTLTATIEPLSAGLPSGTAVAGSISGGGTLSAAGTVTVSGLAGTAVLTPRPWYALGPDGARRRLTPRSDDYWHGGRGLGHAQLVQQG